MKLVELQGATTAPCGYKWYSNNKSRFNGEYEHYLIKEDKKMTREDKLYSMTMANLQIVADKLGIKINPKAAKSKAVEKILEAEADKEWEDSAKPDMPTQEQKPVEQSSEAHKAPETEISSEAKQNTKARGKKANLKLSELTYKGETKSIKEWAAEIEMPWPTLYDRVNRNGWTVEEAIETPLGQRHSK